MPKRWVTALDGSGNPADFAKLVTDAMLLDNKIGDPASIAAAVKAGTIELGSKDELTTPEQKVSFIAKHGLAAWACEQCICFRFVLLLCQLDKRPERKPLASGLHTTMPTPASWENGTTSCSRSRPTSE